MPTYNLTSDACLFHADCRDALAALPPDSIDSVVTDPPYHIKSIAKRFGSPTAVQAQHYNDGAYNRLSTRFIGTEWDGGDVAFRPETWAAVLRVLKPGAHLAAFAFAKSAHRMACAIEDAGFEIREGVAWLYGTGQVRRRENLKAAHEPICIARKPLTESTLAANVERWGVGALQIEAVRPEDGRWPTNLWHDGVVEMPFFYHVKANAADRAGSEHPTVKPVGLIRQLARLVTPPRGVILDPFAGSGTLATAAALEGFRCVLVEREAEYVKDIIGRFIC